MLPFKRCFIFFKKEKLIVPVTVCHAIVFALRSLNLKPSGSFILIYPELCFYIMIIKGKSELLPRGKIGNVFVLKCGCGKFAFIALFLTYFGRKSNLGFKCFSMTQKKT